MMEEVHGLASLEVCLSMPLPDHDLKQATHPLCPVCLK